MKNKYILITNLFLILFSYPVHAYNYPFINVKTYNLFDKSRSRNVPVEIYLSNESRDKAVAGITSLPLVIINHGNNLKNTEYSFIAKHLAAQGFLVASIQHDLPGDPELPWTGNLYEARKPLWERGVQNILFCLKEIKNIDNSVDTNKAYIIGHSNGGDISVLFATKYPEMVKKVVLLDSKRMFFPRTGKPPILSLRANDTETDPGVIPDKREHKKLNITVIKMEDAKHIEMSDRGPDNVKKQINEVVSSFLKKY
jgi:dienelactone hydrolase